MANPTNYAVSYSFASFQANNPSLPLPGPKVDNELAGIQTSVQSLVSSVTDVRRSDGALNDAIVTLDSLAPEIALMFDAGTTANATLLANAVASASASAVGAAASLASAQAISTSTPAAIFASNVLGAETVLTSAATTDIGSTTTIRARVDGNVAITSLGVIPIRLRIVRFTGACKLTQNATTLNLVNGVSRVVSPGDQSIFMSDTSGNWRELSATGIEAPGVVPLGATMIWWDDVLPTSGLWAWANGSTVSAALVAPQLLARWGSKFGGDGVTTMGLPDMRETVPVGQRAMGGASSRALMATGTVSTVSGEATHLLATTEIPAHSHGVTDPGHHHTTSPNGEITPNTAPIGLVVGINPQGSTFPMDTNTVVTGISINNAGGGAAHNNIQPSSSVNYIVRIA